jgi:hypothetical protein
VRSSAPARHRKPPRRGHIVLPTLAAAAILGVGGVGASAALSGGGGGDHPSASRPAAPIATSAPSTTPSNVAPAVAPAVVPTRPPAVPDFAITVTGRVSWVEVIGPRGRVLIAANVRHGRTLVYRQRPLIVTIGDAGAVRLVLHHHAKAPAGKRGAVLRFTYR